MYDEQIISRKHAHQSYKVWSEICLHMLITVLHVRPFIPIQ